MSNNNEPLKLVLRGKIIKKGLGISYSCRKQYGADVCWADLNNAIDKVGLIPMMAELR